MIAKEVNAGKIYIGESAGSMIASSDISYVKDMDDYKIAPELKEYSALGLIDFFPIPHHTNIPFKKIVEKMIDKYTSTLNLYPISNDQAILIKGEKIEVLTK